MVKLISVTEMLTGIIGQYHIKKNKAIKVNEANFAFSCVGYILSTKTCLFTFKTSCQLTKVFLVDCSVSFTSMKLLYETEMTLNPQYFKMDF